jgi:hypothetical protein
MNAQFLEYFLLALAGFIFHFLKLLYTSLNRKEKFLSHRLLVWSLMNILAAAILVYIGESLPPEILVMSPIACVLIGFSGSSMLSGFINVKTPKSKTGNAVTDFELYTEEGEDDDTGGSNPPPDKPKPPTPPGGQP